METRAHHLVIGLFTVIALVAALGFALWLGKSATDREVTYYEVGFDRPVGGLDTGNAVLFSGIRVGDVADLRLDPDDPRLVRALVRIDADIPVREDTRASLVLANITGSMNIQLQGGSPERERLRGSRESPPLILAEPSPLSSLLADGETLVGGLNQLLINANRLLAEENTDRVEQILINLEQLSEELAARSGELGAVVDIADRLGEEATSLLRSLAGLSQSAETLVEGDGRQALESAGQAMGSLQGMARRLEELLGSNEEALGRGMQGLGDLGPTIRELRGTLDTLGRITRRLEENPADFLLGREPIEEFSP
ncbi:MlaD family protein [Halomonas sp. JS92-SW72]|uniref:MlaD family protein n=1 Tax=Halomonas sp. JS92-SW72 TaxID=2306583 RepID=UPI000E5A7F34|nr:MlaD family protein [Halomonas sp. JS92-SW72]AXY43360.1 MCE family protein [Halomonas sp. JS92-SW72]